MNNLLSQYNLTPGERRTLAIIFLVVIVVLNFLFVWPHFGEWGALKKQLAKIRSDAASEQKLIEEDTAANGLRDQVAKLVKQEVQEGGNMSAPQVADPQIQLQNTVMTQERKTGVIVSSQSAGAVKTNDQFFEEHSLNLTMESEEEQLVNFLYNMGNDPAMIRVARLDLKPLDANRYKLRGNLTLTASYTRQVPAAGPKPSVAKPGPKVAAKPQPGTAKPTVNASPARPNPRSNPNPGPPSPNQAPRHQPNTPPNVKPPGFNSNPSAQPAKPAKQLPKRGSNPPD